MTHNDFDFYEDIIRPLMQFLVQSNILNQANFTENDSECSEEEFFDSSKLSLEQLKKDKEAEEKARFIEVSNFNEQQLNEYSKRRSTEEKRKNGSRRVRPGKFSLARNTSFLPQRRKAT